MKEVRCGRDGIGISEPVGEVGGIHRDEASRRDAGDELLISGFDRFDISVVARRRSVERRFVVMHDDVTDLEDEPDRIRGFKS